MPIQSDKLIVEIDVKGANAAQQSVDKFNGSITSATSSLIKMGVQLVGIQQGLSFIKKSIDAYRKQEEIFGQLRQAIDNTDLSYKKLSGEINANLKYLQYWTNYGDDQTAEVLRNLVNLTGDYNKANRVLTLTLDVAASGLMDTTTAARLLGMAVNGDISLLGRYIPELKSTNLETLGLETATEKSEYALKLLQERFGGTAKAAAEATDNYKRYANMVSDEIEAIGKSFNWAFAQIIKFGDNLFGLTDEGDSILKWVEKFNGLDYSGLIEMREAYQNIKNFDLANGGKNIDEINRALRVLNEEIEKMSETDTQILLEKLGIMENNAWEKARANIDKQVQAWLDVETVIDDVEMSLEQTAIVIDEKITPTLTKMTEGWITTIGILSDEWKSFVESSLQTNLEFMNGWDALGDSMVASFKNTINRLLNEFVTSGLLTLIMSILTPGKGVIGLGLFGGVFSSIFGSKSYQPSITVDNTGINGRLDRLIQIMSTNTGQQAPSLIQQSRLNQAGLQLRTVL